MTCMRVFAVKRLLREIRQSMTPWLCASRLQAPPLTVRRTIHEIRLDGQLHGGCARAEDVSPAFPTTQARSRVAQGAPVKFRCVGRPGEAGAGAVFMRRATAGLLRRAVRDLQPSSHKGASWAGWLLGDMRVGGAGWLSGAAITLCGPFLRSLARRLHASVAFR